MTNSESHEILSALREVRLELEALKRMFFEHRPAFVASFAQQRAAVEQSAFLQPLDEAIGALERQGVLSLKS